MLRNFNDFYCDRIFEEGWQNWLRDFTYGLHGRRPNGKFPGEEESEDNAEAGPRPFQRTQDPFLMHDPNAFRSKDNADEMDYAKVLDRARSGDSGSHSDFTPERITMIRNRIKSIVSSMAVPHDKQEIYERLKEDPEISSLFDYLGKMNPKALSSLKSVISRLINAATNARIEPQALKLYNPGRSSVRSHRGLA